MAEIEKKEINLKNGKTLVFPIISEKAVTIGMRRKTRKLSGDAFNEELLWLFFEEYLSDDELEVWDELTAEEFEEAIKASSIEEELKK